ncbi:unnamed protein product [Ectocarpus sp. 4 AP-2014]
MDDFEGSVEEQIGWFGGIGQHHQQDQQQQQQQQQQQRQQLQMTPEQAVLATGNNHNSSAAAAAARTTAVDTSSARVGINNNTDNPPPSPPPPTPLPIPATHAYLGEATTGSSSLSRKDLEEGSTVEIPILALPGVVLFPGESLPLRLHNPAYADLVGSFLCGGAGAGGRGGGDDSGGQQASRHLGVVNRLDSTRGGPQVGASPVGTTAEVRSGHGGSAEDAAGEGEGGDGGGLAMMARGRHRFRLVEDLGWRRGVRYWKVIICPDHCPETFRPPVPRAFREFPGTGRRGRRRRRRDGGNHWPMAVPRFAVVANSPAVLAARAASLLREQREPLPRGSILGAPQVEEGGARNGGEGMSGNVGGGGGGVDVCSAARDEGGVSLGGGGGGGGGCDRSEDEEERMPRRRGKLDPTLFSFWLAANLPLDDVARQELLMLDSVVMRLRVEIKHLEESRRRELCCASCDRGVAWEGDVFTLPGAEGVVGAYVNPTGYVHQTVTVRDARNLVLVGIPEEEHSWFPGYAWTCVYCAFCNEHLGWRFTAIRPGSGEQERRQRQPRSVLLSSGSPPSLPASPHSTSSLLPLPSPPVAGGASGSGGRGALGSSRPATTRTAGGGRRMKEPELGPASFFGLRRPALVTPR